MNKDRAFGFLFLLLLLGAGIVIWVIPAREFSSRENRYLADFPHLSGENLISTDFMDQFEAYLADQFPGRDLWISAKAQLERALGKKENKGIYYGRDGYLLEKPSSETKNLQDNLRYIREFSDWFEGDIKLALVPYSSQVLTDKLPSFVQARPFDEAYQILQKQLPESAIDLYTPLRDAREQSIYFRTDHHWTMRGAAIGASAICRAYGIPYKPPTETQWISQNFYGTYYSKAGDFTVKPDWIEFFPSNDYDKVFVDYLDTGTQGGLFSPKYLSLRDQYSFFLDGNHALLRINSPAPNGKLLMIKDSYAHILAPFLCEVFHEIHMLDLRYYNASVKQYLIEHQIDRVLFVFSLGSFHENSGLIKLSR